MMKGEVGHDSIEYTNAKLIFDIGKDRQWKDLKGGVNTRSINQAC